MKNILLIGGSYGIGSSLAQILAENNQVIIASRSKPENDLSNVKHITFDASNDEICFHSKWEFRFFFNKMLWHLFIGS